MKNKYFVTVTKNVNVVFNEFEKLKGDRFLLKIVYSTKKLDNEGFVVDFSKTNAILDSVKDVLEKELLNNLLGGDFSFVKLLDFIAEFVLEKSNFERCKLTKVILEGEEEGYEVEL